MKNSYSRLSARAAVIVGISAVVIVTAVPSATAHARYVDLYCGVWGYCGWGGVDSSHRLVETYDGDADGFGVRTHYWLKNGASGSVRDPDGYGGEVGYRRVGTSSNPVKYIQVCAGEGIYDDYCTSRYRV